MAKRSRILPNWLHCTESTDTQDKGTVPSKKLKNMECKNNGAEDGTNAVEDAGDNAPSCNREHKTEVQEVDTNLTNIVGQESNNIEDVSTKAEGIAVDSQPHSSHESNQIETVETEDSDVCCENKDDTANQDLLKEDKGNGSAVTTRECTENNATNDDEINVNNDNGDVTESDPVSNTTTNTSLHRSPCKYGANCYRKNPDHLTEFSHPGDTDYSTVDNRPECKYGVSCYRKNPLHKQHYKHTQRMKKPRQAKQRKKIQKDSDSEDDDDDIDDMLFGDDSSDEYLPSDDDYV